MNASTDEMKAQMELLVRRFSVRTGRDGEKARSQLFSPAPLRQTRQLRPALTTFGRACSTLRAVVRTKSCASYSPDLQTVQGYYFWIFKLLLWKCWFGWTYQCPDPCFCHLVHDVYIRNRNSVAGCRKTKKDQEQIQNLSFCSFSSPQLY